MDEFHVFKTALKGNLKLLDMISKESDDKKDKAMLFILIELRNLLNKVIPIYEKINKDKMN